MSNYSNGPRYQPAPQQYNQAPSSIGSGSGSRYGNTQQPAYSDYGMYQPAREPGRRPFVCLPPTAKRKLKSTVVNYFSYSNRSRRTAIPWTSRRLSPWTSRYAHHFCRTAPELYLPIMWWSQETWVLLQCTPQPSSIRPHPKFDCESVLWDAQRFSWWRP